MQLERHYKQQLQQTIQQQEQQVTISFQQSSPRRLYRDVHDTSNYNETSANTTTDGSDSDADPTTGNAPLTNLVSGESDQTIDAGIYRPAIIGDYVWRDTDGDGIQDPTETGINGVTVLLKDAAGNVLQTAVTTNSPTTGAPGYYNFTVDPGTYIVMVMAPTGTHDITKWSSKSNNDRKYITNYCDKWKYKYYN
jgi:hypothetical protein